MFQVTSPMAGLFIALHHNVTVPVEIQPGVFQENARKLIPSSPKITSSNFVNLRDTVKESGVQEFQEIRASFEIFFSFFENFDLKKNLGKR